MGTDRRVQLKRADHVRMSRKGRRRLHWRSGHVARLAGTRSVSLFQFAARPLHGSQWSSTSSFSAVSAANFAVVSAASMQNSVLQQGCQSISAMWRRVLCICMLQASCMCTSQASLRAPVRHGHSVCFGIPAQRLPHVVLRITAFADFLAWVTGVRPREQLDCTCPL